MDGSTTALDKRIDDLYQAIEISQNAVIWILILFVFAMVFFFILDMFRRREIEGELRKARYIRKKLESELKEYELFKPILYQLFADIILSQELSIQFSDLPPDKKMALLKQCNLNYEHLKLITEEKNKNIQALHRLLEDGTKESLLYLEYLETVITQNKQTGGKKYEDIEKLFYSVIDEIRFKTKLEQKK